MGDSAGNGNDASKEGGVRRRLMSSSPSLNSSASHRLFLVRLAGGKIGGGCSFEGWSLAVSAMTDGGGPAAMVVERHRWRRRRCFCAITVVVRVGNRQKTVTS